MGWVSCIEDIQRRLDDACFELLRKNPDVPRSTESIRQLKTLVERLRVQLYDALDLLTQPGSPLLDFDVTTTRKVVVENSKLKAQAAEQSKTIDRLRSELARSRTAEGAAQASLEDAVSKIAQIQDEHSFLTAMGGKRIIEASQKKRSYRR